MLRIFIGSIARSAKCRYLSYSEGNLSFLPCRGNTLHLLRWNLVWRSGPTPLCQIQPHRYKDKGIGPQKLKIFMYKICGKVSVRSSVTMGVASSVANDVIMLNGGCERHRCDTREWHHNENDIIMIIASLWRYGDWRHVAMGRNTSFTKFWNINAPQGCIPCAIFTKSAVFVVCLGIC